MPTVKDLVDALDRAEDARQRAEHDRDAKRRRSLDAFAAKLDAELDAEFGPGLAALRQEEWDAREALDAARLAEGRERLADLPRGVLVEWAQEQTSWSRSTGPVKPTGRRAVLEVVGPHFRAPAGRVHGLPRQGEVILRLLKKDGSPAPPFEELPRSWEGPDAWRRWWLPAGVDWHAEEEKREAADREEDA